MLSSCRGLVLVLVAIRSSGEVRHEGGILTRTGTRPPHPLHPSPCPYSEGSGQRPLLLVLVSAGSVSVSHLQGGEWPVPAVTDLGRENS
jgi:hypothetical protein